MKRIYLIGEIGMELNIDYLQFQMRDINPDEELEAVVCSPGGKVLEAIAMKGLLALHKGRKTAHIVGLAGSSMTGLLHAFDEVSADVDAWYMIHNLKGTLRGTTAEMERQLESVKGFNDQIVRNLVAKSGKGEAEVVSMMNAETWMTAQQAVDNGFIDSVVSLDKSAYNADIEDAENLIMGIVNKAVPSKTPKPTSMNIDSLLNLSGNPTDEQRTAAVQSLVNQVRDLQADIDKRKKALSDKDTQMTELQNTVESLASKVEKSTGEAQVAQREAELMRMLTNKGRTLSDDARKAAMRRLTLIHDTEDEELVTELRNDLSTYIENNGVEISERFNGSEKNRKNTDSSYEERVQTEMENLKKDHPDMGFEGLMALAKNNVNAK